MGFFVKLWGTRGSVATPGRAMERYGGNTTCIEVRIDDTLFICDAGTGLREMGLNLLQKQTSPINAHWLFSHTHWDHIQGFPQFLPAFRPENTFRVYGREANDRTTFDLLCDQMSEEYCPISFSHFSADIIPTDLATVNQIVGGVKISWFGQYHEGGSYAYSFEKDGYKFVFATDNEIDLGFEDPEAVQGNLAAPRPIPQDYLDFIRGADLLVADGQYTDAEYPQRIGWGHARATTVLDAAIQAEVKQVAITHHDPVHTDRCVDEKIKACAERLKKSRADLVLFGAREELEFKIAG